ncbi:prosalusin [Syngnathus typhle]|uniref:prosalusin n=1 Tax=Syngnathus typhle TaxID=161592 RepID=UPI002A6A1ECC|nr:prosalusin [Syngnathus typhle]
MLTLLALLLLCICTPGRCIFQELYCTIADSCNCDFRPNVRELEWDLYKNVYGQHLAQEILSEEVARFLAEQAPERPLVLSLHGSSGTGKTMAAGMLARHLYGSAMSSPFIHQFITTLHFPAGRHVDAQQEQLKSWVQGNVTACGRSVFIFDEMDKMAPGLLDVLEPFLGASHVVFGTNYRKAIYVLISTAGEEVINKAALEQREAGRDREEMTAAELQDAIAQAVYNNPTSGLYKSSIIRQKLVTAFVPFLPLCRLHVERCARAQLCQRGACERQDVARAVAADMTYKPSPGHYFSTSGCKTVPAKIDLLL